MKSISLLYPENKTFISLTESLWQDLGMNRFIETITKNKHEKQILKHVMMQMNKEEEVSQYRIDIFHDIITNENLRKNIIKILSQVEVLESFMSLKRNIDQKDTIWSLTRRLKEVQEYIFCIEELEKILETDIHSEGLLNLKKYVHEMHNECGFEELKKDILALQLDTSKIKSVTLGVNLNENYEVISTGIVSLNQKPFTESHILSNFSNSILKKNRIQTSNDWNENYTYETVNAPADQVYESVNRIFASGLNPMMGVGISLANVHYDEIETNLMQGLTTVVDQMLVKTVKKCKAVLSKYATLHVHDITNLIPEFTFYILWAEAILKLQKKGYIFSRPVVDTDTKIKQAYNLKLIQNHKIEEIKKNDLEFDLNQYVHVLTGANSGGKTTFTQTIGQLFLMAQSGLYVPAEEFHFKPVDCIFSHFPVDEFELKEYGRLEEECVRFKEIYDKCSSDSLILLNETFSTTSLEEGKVIAQDVIKALSELKVYTIYNTHMHSLSELDYICPLVADLDYSIQVGNSAGCSYSQKIAQKYGCTYEQLIKNKKE